MAFAALILVDLSTQAKNAVPSEDAQRQAEKTIRARFSDEYSAKSAVDQQKLARKLLGLAGETGDDLALRFILYRDACDLATRAGDLDTLLRSIDDVHGGFHIVGLALKGPYLLKMEPLLTKPEELQRLAEVLIRLAQEALDLDQIDVAMGATQSSLVSAKKAKDNKLTARAEAAKKSVLDMKIAFEKAKKAEEVLASAPEDPNANVTWGEWLCLRKGRWDLGLAFLVKGPNSPMRAMAAKEYAGSAELESLMDVADGWWELAAREQQAPRRTQLIAHARSIYSAALSKSSGEVRAKIGKRLEFDPEPPTKK